MFDKNGNAFRTEKLLSIIRQIKAETNWEI